MRIRLLLGPAGSGKTFSCLAEIRAALEASPDGAPLVLLAPKQMTYQLERQLLSTTGLEGYTRLQILSFERFATRAMDWLRQPVPPMLDEEGRLMVMRALLATGRQQLRLFRASARLSGFARELSSVLRELQAQGLEPERLLQLAGRLPADSPLSLKLHDLACLLRQYLGWLEDRRVLDADSLLPGVIKALDGAAMHVDESPFRLAGLWVDGFAEWSAQELELLAAVMPFCEEVTITFCLEDIPGTHGSWLSSWAVPRQCFDKTRLRLSQVPGGELSVQVLNRRPDLGRFRASPALGWLEKAWDDADAGPGAAHEAPPQVAAAAAGSLSLVACAKVEAEVIVAAREILRHVQAGGRYRETAVLVRKLEGYHETLERVFARYGIPFFLDRREAVSHHPLAELTRNALRTVALGWKHDDWFGVLKTGLVPAKEEELATLENEALARGWQGKAWQKPLTLDKDGALSAWLAKLMGRLLPPFHKLSLAFARQNNQPNGQELASAVRALWDTLGVPATLEQWAAVQPVHATVLDEMESWLDNLELAFGEERLALTDWLPILDAGMSNLTVGVIPPALDQVLVGPIDRSRNADVRLALVLGMNENTFPAVPAAPPLITEHERTELEELGVELGGTFRHQLARERHFAYVACTRARERLVLSWAQADAEAEPLAPSIFIQRIRRLFPGLKPESSAGEPPWLEAVHPSELLVPLLKAGAGAHDLSCPTKEEARKVLACDGSLASAVEGLGRLEAGPATENLPRDLAERLYGKVLHTSVSRTEEFAACPFRFFVHSGLRAEERREFKLDEREQGSFQHDVLAIFHEKLREQGKRWRDLTSAEAREHLARIAWSLAADYRDGLLQSSQRSRFMARAMAESLEDFVEILVTWMHGQYQFDPVSVELPFGNATATAWRIPLESGRALELQGRIDRVDLFRLNQKEALCVVVDYKSSQKKLEPALMRHGIQMQLLAYLNVLRHWANPQATFGCERLIPAGVFYVNLRGQHERGGNRTEALGRYGEERKLAYRHAGRFNSSVLTYLDGRQGALQGDQFNYRKTKSGDFYKNCQEPMAPEEFEALLVSIEEQLREIGNRVFAGETAINPYVKGGERVCEQCHYAAICRIDPWTHTFRSLEGT